jgi:hypothetical protein
LGEMRKLNTRALRILAEVEGTKDHATALTAIRECRRNLELIAKLTGELDPRAAGETPGGSLQVTVIYAAKAAMVVCDTPAPLPALPEARQLNGGAPDADTEAS